MVIIETALIGGAAYGAYRGGEKAVHVGSRKVEDMKRERRRKEDQRDFHAKSRDRSSRLNSITNQRNAAASTTSSSTLISSATTSTPSISTTSSSSDVLQKDRFSSIKERYSQARKPVTEKKGLFGKFLVGTKKKSSK